MLRYVHKLPRLLQQLWLPAARYVLPFPTLKHLVKFWKGKGDDETKMQENIYFKQNSRVGVVFFIFWIYSWYLSICSFILQYLFGFCVYRSILWPLPGSFLCPAVRTKKERWIHFTWLRQMEEGSGTGTWYMYLEACPISLDPRICSPTHLG